MEINSIINIKRHELTKSASLIISVQKNKSKCQNPSFHVKDKYVAGASIKGGGRGATTCSPLLCVEMGFRWKSQMNQDATMK